MIEIHLVNPCLIQVNYFKDSGYYEVSCNNQTRCAFYIKDYRPYNSVLCFINNDNSCSYITFYKNHLEVLHNELTTLQYTEKDIKQAFSILGIKVREYDSLLD